MTLKSYKLETIQKIKEQGNAFDDWDDEDIAYMYADWSQATFSAKWIVGGEEDFYMYATTRPIDVFIKQINK